MTFAIARAIEQMAAYQAGKPIEETKRELGLDQVIKLASNENPLGPSPRAAEAMRMAIAELHRYPDSSGYRLKRVLAQKLSAAYRPVAPEEVLLGNGSNEILVLLMRALGVAQKNVVIGWPSFIVYPMAAEAVGLEVRKVPLGEGFCYDAEHLLGAVDADTQAIMLGHPNNPTGTYLARRGIERILGAIPESTLLVIDEAYVEYVDAPDYLSGLSLAAKNVVVLRTMSKAYGLAGMRLGYAVGDRALLGYLDRVRDPFNVNSLAQIGAEAALDDAQHIERVVATNAGERTRTVAALRALGLSVADTQANFALAGFERVVAPVYRALLQKGVIVRPLEPYGMSKHLRISFGTRSENDRLIEALREVLHELA